jgi:hypothetical protein
MVYTIEDVIEILNQNRYKFRVTGAEKNILASLSKQISENIGLTDRQLSLCLKKIQYHSKKLEESGVDVSALLTQPSLRIPLREIDRSQRITLEETGNEDKPILLVKFDYSKDFSNFWASLRENLTGKIFERSNYKEVPVVESNIMVLVEALKDRGFTVSDELMKIYQKLEHISEHPKNFLPFIDVVNGQFQLKNANRNLEKYLKDTVAKEPTISDIKWLMTAKSCGVNHKSTEAIEKIYSLTKNKSAIDVLSSIESRFRVDTDQYSLNNLTELVNSLEIWPVLFIVDEDDKCLDIVKDIHRALQSFLDSNQLTVFFRLANGQNNHHEFSQFVKDNHLNNYIGSNTQAVIISKNRIPKPLVTADWHPKTAVITSAHDHGKMSTYLNDFETVFYYNKSLQMRHSRAKGAKKIAEL